MLRWLMVLLLAVPVSVAAQAGPHAVGFRVVAARDSTRAFEAKVDWTGERSADPSRPVPIEVWYPAVAVDGAPGMQVWEFRARAQQWLRTMDDESARERARIRFLGGAALLNATEEDRIRLWSDTTAARRDAPPAEGRFPLVLFMDRVGIANPGLADHLASHGYVVASLPGHGRMTEGSLAFTPNPLTLDVHMDDAGFALATVSRLPFVDAGRVAVVTFSSSSLAALLWQMRDMQADALAFIEGWERYRTGVDLLRTSPHYDVRRVRVPMLLLERAADEASPSFAKVGDVVDSLHFAPMHRVSFHDALHIDFLSHVFGGSPAQPRIFATTASLIRSFIDAALTDVTSLEIPPSELYTVLSRDPSPAQPTEEELFRMFEIDPRAAERVYLSTRGDGPPMFRRQVLTRAAMFALNDEDRVVILRVVADAYPQSTDARFRLAEALAAVGRRDDAVATLRAALDLVSEDPELSDAARGEWRRRIDERLSGLR